MSIIKEQLIEGQHTPIKLKGIKKIVEQMEKCICKIYVNQKKGTGFFCKISNRLYTLITNNHILNEEDIEENKTIDISINDRPKIIKIDKTRKKYTDETLDITFIEIKPNEDDIHNYLEIDEEDINEKKNNIELEYKNKSIYILHYPKGELSISCGVIKEIKNRKIIEHLCSTEEGSSGSPLLSLKTYKVIGIHFGGDLNEKINYGIFIKYAIDIFINNINKNNNNNINNNKNNNIYRNEINIKYKTKEKRIENIFGEKFVENNKNNIELIINGEKSKLIPKYELNEGINNITIIIKNKLTNLEEMFKYCYSLNDIGQIINELKYLNTKDIDNFEYIFYDCFSLSDIKPLEKWNVSNGNNFGYMFNGCTSLSDIKPLQNWNVINGNNFRGMFAECSSLSDIKPLQNWNVSNVNNFGYMFWGCTSLSNIKPIQNWNISKGNNFEGMFYGCSSLSDKKPLQNWNLPKSHYDNMF